MQIRNITLHTGLFVAIGLAVQLAGCGGGGHTADSQGTLRVALTNTGTSACGFEEVNISVDAVRVNQSASAGPADGSWQPKDVTLAQAKQVELLGLINEPPKDLVTLTLPAGHYAQVRVWLEEPSALILTPNSVVQSGTGSRTEVALDTSGASSIRIDHEFNVPANGQVNLILNFDACASVVEPGNGTFKLVPSITATSTPGT